MTGRHRTNGVARRAGAATLGAGLLVTTALVVLVEYQVDRIRRDRVDAPAQQPLLTVEHLTSSVDQVLATANGAVCGSERKR